MTGALGAHLERYFEFQRLGTNWKTEILAGITTFMTMAYIVFVNPSILHEAGMPLAAVTAATCLSAAFGSILMGAFARYPLALAPGMGLNAYFHLLSGQRNGSRVADGPRRGIPLRRELSGPDVDRCAPPDRFRDSA